MRPAGPSRIQPSHGGNIPESLDDLGKTQFEQRHLDAHLFLGGVNPQRRTIGLVALNRRNLHLPHGSVNTP
eukprot:747205-Hanusia_phi.AAC.4